jgi:hypothetical protein
LVDLLFGLGYGDPKPRKGGKASKNYSLTDVKAHKARPRRKRRAGWPDGRRKFGTVGGAIVQVLFRAGGKLSVKTIRAEVEQLARWQRLTLLGRGLPAQMLEGMGPLFDRTRHGHYRLIR